jgi:hypothetical protein
MPGVAVSSARFQEFSRASDDMKRTSVRSFGAAALSMGPEFITAAIPPDLQNRKSGS